MEHTARSRQHGKALRIPQSSDVLFTERLAHSGQAASLETWEHSTEASKGSGREALREKQRGPKQIEREPIMQESSVHRLAGGGWGWGGERGKGCRCMKQREGEMWLQREAGASS